MTREDAIRIIEDLYPADSQFNMTAARGQEILDRAKREVASWRQEETPVLIRYAELCIDEEGRP